ncbi:MAG: threonine--tRNA ligase [Candidatus Levyibacteriota bacterium]
MNDQEHLQNLRHSTAHLLAAAALKLYPDTKLTIGPAIQNGFYYDFDFAKPISEEDLPKFEKEMTTILKTWKGFSHREVSEKEAKEIYKNNEYKRELIDEIVKRGEKITLYKVGDFEDLCRGGHSENPQKDIGAFKLLSIAGAYWRGDEKNKMLTRIYGTAFPTKKELDEHLEMLEEAKKRDHRKIGKELELFTISEEVGPGLAIWLPKGTIIKEELENFAKETERKGGYQRVSTPHIAKDKLYYTSGHLPYYKEDMYPAMESPDGTYYLKPMNCPHMHMVYKAKMHSYRELPIRYAEFGTVYRYEDSGTLFGLMRVRGLTQNDAHIYTTEETVVDELIKVLQLHAFYYDLFGIKDYYVELALPDLEKKKDKYFDNPKAWEKSTNILREAAKKSGLKVVENVGGAAFYGPKFDFNIRSAIGREFGASTNQLDFGSGERFGLTYIDSDGAEKTVPYIIHRAPLGSTERFLGFLIEHYAGAFPLWLAPVQVVLLPIADRHAEDAEKVAEMLRNAGIRVEVDTRSERLQAKIRDATLQKVPFMGIIGDKEIENNAISVRKRNGEDLGQLKTSAFQEQLLQEIDKKS